MNLSPSVTAFDWLQDWYRSHCNGVWEHEHGISITTLDNPGWCVVIDLKGTDLEGSSMPSHASDQSEGDWVFCKIDAGKFIAHGDPTKLIWIVAFFRTWSERMRAPDR